MAKNLITFCVLFATVAVFKCPVRSWFRVVFQERGRTEQNDSA